MARVLLVRIGALQVAILEYLPVHCHLSILIATLLNPCVGLQLYICSMRHGLKHHVVVVQKVAVLSPIFLSRIDAELLTIVLLLAEWFVSELGVYI